MKFIDYLNQLVEKSNEKTEFKVEYKIKQIIKCKGFLERNIIKRSMKGYRSFTINWDPVRFEFDFDVVKEVCDIINHDKDFHITLNMKINQKHEHDYKLTITW